jgi:cytochrome b6-f complex subunit 5
LNKCIKTLKTRRAIVIEPILLGIVLGLVPVTLAGLFVAAYTQYRRGNQLNM